MDISGVREQTRLMARLAALLLTASLAISGCWFDGVAGEAKPLPDPTSSPVFEDNGDGTLLVFPVSAPIEIGQKYRFELQTHCGLEAAPVDVDGSMWDYAGPFGSGASERLEGFDDPSDIGTLTLVSKSKLDFTSSGGKTVFFERYEGGKVIPRLYVTSRRKEIRCLQCRPRTGARHLATKTAPRRCNCCVSPSRIEGGLK